METIHEFRIDFTLIAKGGNELPSDKNELCMMLKKALDADDLHILSYKRFENEDQDRGE